MSTSYGSISHDASGAEFFPFYLWQFPVAIHVSLMKSAKHTASMLARLLQKQTNKQKQQQQNKKQTKNKRKQQQKQQHTQTKTKQTNKQKTENNNNNNNKHEKTHTQKEKKKKRRKREKKRSAQMVFACVAKLQFLLRANDIERNPAPDPDMEINAAARTFHTAGGKVANFVRSTIRKGIPDTGKQALCKNRQWLSWN